jgi:hypothetical protein
MLKDYLRWMAIKPTPEINFNQFTHLVTRSVL